jgi:protein arginine kinase
MANWQKYCGSSDELVLSCRIRVARNLKNRSFPHKVSDQEAREIVKDIEEAVFSTSYIESTYKPIHLWECDDLTTSKYVEEHLISVGLANNKEGHCYFSTRQRPNAPRRRKQTRA